MKSKAERIVESIVRKQILKESKQDIRKIDKSNMATNSSVIIDAFIQNGFKGTYDPETGQGELIYKGKKIEFSTGGENLYFTIHDLYTKGNPEETVQAMKKFIDFTANYM